MEDQIVQQLGQFLFTLGGSGLLGFFAGFFIKKAIKIVAFVMGGIVTILAFLSWKHIIDVNWNELSNQTYSVANTTLHTVSSMAQSVGEKIDAVNGFTIGGSTIGFIGGFMIGIKVG